MLLPTNRLMFCCIVTLLPAALLAAVLPHLLWFAVAAALVAVTALVDALAARELSVTFTLPEATNFSCGRAGTLSARLS